MDADTIVKWTIGDPETANGEFGEWGECLWSNWTEANGDDPEFVAEVEAELIAGRVYHGGGGAAPEITVEVAQ